MTTQYTIAAASIVTVATAAVVILCLKSAYSNTKELVDSFKSKQKIETRLSIPRSKKRIQRNKRIQKKLRDILLAHGGSMTSGVLNQKHGIRRPDLNKMLDMFPQEFTQEIIKRKIGGIKKIIHLNKVND